MKLHRKERGWSQAVLAAQANINRGYVSDLEQAKYAASLDVIESLAAVFEVDAATLISSLP